MQAVRVSAIVLTRFSYVSLPKTSTREYSPNRNHTRSLNAVGKLARSRSSVQLCNDDRMAHTYVRYRHFLCEV